jgi:ribosomal protein L35
MPKMKTDLLEKKSSERKRRLGRETDIAKADERATRRMLGI